MSVNKIKTRSVLISGVMALAPSVMMADEVQIPCVFDYYKLSGSADKFISFDPTGTGESLPVVWGLDTAWLSESNTIRGMRHMTPEVVDVMRVSYEPYALVTTPGVLPDELKAMLDRRLAECDRIAKARKDGQKPMVALNLDASNNQRQQDYFYIYTAENDKGELEYRRDYEKGTKNHEEWAKLIHAYVKYIEDKGFEVVSIAPFNEPDEVANALTIDHFKNINRILRENYPDLANIRISGGNTLNTDSAFKWYDYLKENLDEGNTHELAGTFENYANFFQTVRNDGKWATADELHNTMECMVGAEYGMQTGIWWGQAERTRGEFCQASNTGTRLAYAENRGAWNSAAVYESRGKVQAFVGASERQARESSYSFVSTRPVYYDGVGPTNEFKVMVAGDPNGAYQTEKQRTAEGVYDLAWGEDVRPEIDGTYYIINKSSGKAVSFNTSLTNTPLVLATYNSNAEGQKWNVGKVAYNMGGDFAYFYINANVNNGLSWNLFNFGLSENYDPTENSNNVPVYCFPNGMFSDPSRTVSIYDINMEWWLEYEGDGWFCIKSKTSDYCVKNRQGSTADGTELIQAPYSKGDDTQLFRFVSVDEAPAVFEMQSPAAPTNVYAKSEGGSIRVSWDAVDDSELSGYALMRADNESDEYATIARGLKTTEIIDNTVLTGNTYNYKVVAFDRSGNRSLASNASGASPETNASGLVSLYAFEDNLDDSFNMHHGRTTNSPTYANGHTGRALRVEANSGKTPQLPVSAVPQGGVMTFCAWVNSPSQSATQAGGYVFDFGMDDEHHVSLSYFDQNSEMKVTVVNGGEAKTMTAPSPQSRTWHHVGVVLGKTEWTLYVDGEVVASLSEAGLSDYMPVNKMLLNYLGRSLREYTYRESDGYTVSISPLNAIDEVRIYERALSQGDVQLDMAGAISGVNAIESPRAEEVGREYFNMKGQSISTPAHGEPAIVRIRKSDGSVEVRKVAER